MTTTYTVQQILNAAAQNISLGAAVIADNSVAVMNNLDLLQPIAANGGLGAITFTDATPPTLITSGFQLANDAAAAALFRGAYTLNVSNATVAQAEQLSSQASVSITISDAPNEIEAAMDMLQPLVAAGKVTAISVLPYGQSQIETQTLTFTQADVARDPAAFALVSAERGGRSGWGVGVTVTVSGTFSAQQAVAVEAMNGYVTGLTVVDSVAGVETALGMLTTRPEVNVLYEGMQPSYYSFSSVTLTDAGTPTIVVPFSQSQAHNIQNILTNITNRHAVLWTGVPVGEVASLLDPSSPASQASIQLDVTDIAATIASAIDYIEPYDLAGKIHSITTTDGVLPTFTAAQSNVDISVISKITVGGLTASAAIADAGQLQALHGVAVRDGAAGVSAALDGLESLAKAGKLVSIALTDVAAIPTLALTTAQASADADALNSVQGKFSITQTAGGTSESIAGVAKALGNIVVFADPANAYTITPDGNGTGFTLSQSGMADHLSDIQALQFADHTEIVASTAHLAGAAVSSAQVTNLYAAVFSREPDIAGLGFYEANIAANPAVGIVTYGQYFLSSPEYTSNAAHNYAQTDAGETQFVTDTYNNLLHRGPEAGAVDFYLGVIKPMLANLTPGTTAYAQADLTAHATVLAYFSESPEFLSDVQVTAAHPADAQHWLVLI